MTETLTESWNAGAENFGPQTNRNAVASFSPALTDAVVAAHQHPP